MDRPTTMEARPPQGRPTRPFRLLGGLRAALVPLIFITLLPMSTGCQIIIGTVMMLKGRDLEDCEFKQRTGETLKGKDKRVVILSNSPESARSQYGALDIDVIAGLSRRLKLQDINVVDTQKVATWIDDHGSDVDDVQVADLAKEFKANYVILIRFTQVSFTEPNSPQLLRGSASALISTVKFTKENGVQTPHTIYTGTMDAKFPSHQALPLEQRDLSVFRRQFIDQVADELTRKFWDYRPGDEF